MLVTRSTFRAMLVLSGLVLCCGSGCDRASEAPPASSTSPGTVPQTKATHQTTSQTEPEIDGHEVEPEAPPDPELLTRIGTGLLAAAPASEGLDSAAHRRAADRLSKLVDLIDAGDEIVLWGALPSSEADRPPDARLTRMVPMVLARAYLSLFAFSGDPAVRVDGKLRLLEVPATFRVALDASDYPEVLWHSAANWRSFAATRSILFVFKGDLLLSVYRIEADTVANLPPAPARWDGNWRWPARDGRDQPYASTFESLLSEENPQRATLEEDYRLLDRFFTANNCYSCHCPAPADNSPPVVVLNYPIQALAARRTLVAVVQGKLVPTGHTAIKPKPMSSQELVDIVNAAAGFEGEADAALAYEAARRALP